MADHIVLIIKVQRAEAVETAVNHHCPELDPAVFLGGGFNFSNFHPYLGKILILTNIFQMG